MKASTTQASNRTRVRTWCSAPAALLVAFAAHAAPPQIDMLSRTTLDRSGRLEIFGANFGASQSTSEVRIGGLTAIATTWTDTEIHAYVPELTSLGDMTLQVVTAEGSSAEQTLTVTPRQSMGRTRWSFQLDSVLAGQFTALGADGTVYVTDNLRLYALSPDGGLQWVLTGAGGGRPISVDEDGTIYTGAGPVHAVNPDGTYKWTFMPPGWPSLMAGPSMGPDGNLYATQNTAFGGEEELGMFSLDRDGNLRWSNNSERFQFSSNGDNSAIKFGSDRLYVGIISDAGAPPSLDAYDMDGSHLWYAGDLLIPGGTHPQLDPFGRVIFRRGQTSMQAISPDGDVEWFSTHPDDGNLLVMPAIDADGVIYTGGWLGLHLWAINPDGSTRWVQPREITTQLINLDLTPDDALLFAGGGGTTKTALGWVRGIDPNDGIVQWQVNLPRENGFFQFIRSMEQTFTPDSQTAYFTTAFGAHGANGYLYAVDTSHPSPCPADLDGSGAVDFSDILAILSAWGNAGGPQDLDGSGTVDFGDLLVVLGSWGPCV